jgi:hypothetical protein
VDGDRRHHFGAPLQLSGVGVAIGAGIGVLAGLAAGDVAIGVAGGAFAGWVVAAVLDGLRFRRHH